MDIELGKPVVTEGGKQIGSVDGLIFDPHSKELVQLLVKQGTLLSKDRIAAIDEVASVDGDGTVHLSIPDSMADQLPAFVEREFVIVKPHEYPDLPPSFAGGTGAGLLFWGGSRLGLGYDPHSQYFETAPLDPPETEIQSNVDENMVVIKAGTDVVGSDGDKLGDVDHVLYNEDGEITGLVVKAGFLFHHDVQIPANWIETVTGDQVRLNVSSDEAEHAGRA